MKTFLFFHLFLIFSFAFSACGPSQAELATQKSIAETATAVSWTTKPTPTLTPTTTPTPTLTPTTTPTPTPTPIPVYTEDFEDGEAQNWRTGEEWSIQVDVDGNHYWRATGPEIYPYAWYSQLETLRNYAFESQVRFVKGTVFITLRNGGGGFYTVPIDSSAGTVDVAQYEVHIDRSAGTPDADDIHTTWKSLNYITSAGIVSGRWYTIRVEALTDRLVVYVDGKKVVEAVLPQPVVNPSGSFGYYIGQGEEINFDNIRVWELP